MGILPALRFKLMFAWVFLLRALFPYAAGNNLAANTIRFLHPGLPRQKPAYMAGLDKVLENPALSHQAWQRHRTLVGVTRFQGAYYARPDTRWISQCELTLDGAEHVHAARALGRGVLVMTYHHHFNMLFCNLLSRLDYPITTIAMDARDNNPRYQKFGNRVEKIYGHAEQLLNGGEIILVKPNSPVRPILRAFENNHLVITANDFPNVFNDKNRKDFAFLGTTLSCPTGTVKLAVKKCIPAVAGYLNWQGGNRFSMTLRLVSDGNESMQVKQAMANYLGVLEEMVESDPGLWEGWKWLG